VLVFPTEPGDAYLNEMGITNRLQPDEVTKLCNTASEPNDTPGPDGLSDIDHFARFIRATKAPARDSQLAGSAAAKKGAGSRNKIRTAPLWGVRLRPRLMHDGASMTLRDAILRHRGEANHI
jgi:cytochrome c peroxidase